MKQECLFPLMLTFGITVLVKLGQTEDDDDLKKELREYLENDIFDHAADGVSLTQQKMTEVDLPNPCPRPLTTTVSPEHCLQPPCQANSNCTQPNHLCCFNGCVHTCEPNIQQPPVIDWEDEDWNKLVGVRKHEDYEVSCSTANGHVMPSCPDGYICQILEKGDPLRAIPNRGVCVNLSDFAPGGVGMFFGDAASEWNEIEPATVKESVYLPGGCLISTEQYSDIEEFIKGRHFTSCICSSGTVFCSVPQQGK